jgi:hypothetical protein
MPSEIGVITEQGDLGLGFNPLSEKDKQALNESAKDEDKDKKK